MLCQLGLWGIDNRAILGPKQLHQENMKMLNFCLILLNLLNSNLRKISRKKKRDLLFFYFFELSGLSKIKQKLSIFMFSWCWARRKDVQVLMLILLATPGPIIVNFNLVHFEPKIDSNWVELTRKSWYFSKNSTFWEISYLRPNFRNSIRDLHTPLRRLSGFLLAVKQ